MKSEKNDSIHTVQALSIANPEQLIRQESEGDVYVGADIQRWFHGKPRGDLSLLEGSPDAATLIQESEDVLREPGSPDLKPIYLRPTTFVKAPPARISLPDDIHFHGASSEQ
jgi:hypothetical protein